MTAWTHKRQLTSIMWEAYRIGVVQMTRVLGVPLIVTTMAMCTLGQGPVLQPQRGLLAICYSTLQACVQKHISHVDHNLAVFVQHEKRYVQTPSEGEGEGEGDREQSTSEESQVYVGDLNSETECAKKQTGLRH